MSEPIKSPDSSLPYVFHLRNKSFFRSKEVILFDQKEQNIRYAATRVSYSQFMENLKSQPFKVGYIELVSRTGFLPSVFPITIYQEKFDKSSYTYPFWKLKTSGNITLKLSTSFERPIQVDALSKWIMELPPRFDAYFFVYPAEEIPTKKAPVIRQERIIDDSVEKTEKKDINDSDQSSTPDTPKAE